MPPVIVFTLVNAHRQEVDALGPLPAWQRLSRLVDHLAGLAATLHGEVGQDVGGKRKIIHLVENKQARRASYDQKKHDQARCQEHLSYIARTACPSDSTSHVSLPTKHPRLLAAVFNVSHLIRLPGRL
jgi:hypothetical protein